MTQALCFLVPSFICTSIFEKIQKKQFDIKKFLVKYIILTGVINMICFGVITIFFQKTIQIINSNLFSISFVLKYLLLSLAVAMVLPYLHILYVKYNRIRKEDVTFTKKQKLILSVVVSFFFVFTIIVFTPYDIFFGNQSEFVFSFTDFWWIMASFGLVVFAVLTVVFMILPVKVFSISVSIVFSLTLCAYIQRMFLNLYVTNMVGNQLITKNHPIWALINFSIWICLIGGIYVLQYLKGVFWKKTVLSLSLVLIFVQVIALMLFAYYKDNAPEKRFALTTDGLYEVASENNIIVFVLDHYDFSYVETVQNDTPNFYDKLEGFTHYDNMTSVYSRSYPSNTYLLTGLELEEYYVNSYADCIDNAFSKSTFLPYLKESDYNIGVYTLMEYVSENCQETVENYTDNIKMLYFETVYEFLRAGFYFEAPYILKPYFWFFDEIKVKTIQDTAYNYHDEIIYKGLVEKGLTIGSYKSAYKYIHTFGAHAPYVLTEDCIKDENGVQPVQQWKGCINMVCEYLDQMKKLGVYDAATIIITADHGHVYGFDSLDTLNLAVAPILFVKPAYAKLEPLKLSHSPVSHADIFPTIMQAAGGDYAVYGSGRPIASIGENEPRTRIFHYAEMEKEKEKELVDYEIIGDSKDFSNWNRKSSKAIIKSIYPVVDNS